MHAIIHQNEEDLRHSRGGFEFPVTPKIYTPSRLPPPDTFFNRLPKKIGPAIQYRWLRRSWRGPASSVLLETHHIIRQILERVSMDVVIFTDLASMSAAPLVRRLAPRSIRILNADNIDHHLIGQEMISHKGNNGHLRDLRKSYRQTRWSESHLGKFVHAVFACSEEDRAVLQSLNKGSVKGFTIPNGVDTSARPFDQKTDKHRLREILFCGSLDYLPNQDGLLWFYKEIWPLIVARQPDLRLTVVGRGAGGGVLTDLRSDLLVNYIGEVEDVLPYYRRASVSVVPLRMGSGSRLKILEAMSLGNPVVSTTIGSAGIQARDGKEIVIADEPVEFAAAVTSLLNNVGLFDDIRRSANLLVRQKYDWIVVGRMMDEAIYSLR